MTEPLLTQLVRTLARPIGESERRRARLHLLDWLACVAGGKAVDLAVHWIPAAKVLSGMERRNDIAFERATLLGNVLEMDDIHRAARLHPGPVVWPVAIFSQGDFESALEAAVRGYEAMIAIGETLDARHYAFYHNTATAGNFGAAVAACRQEDIVGEPVRIEAALAFAGSVTGGLWQMRHEPGAGKQWHILHAARTGMAAAEFARGGYRGPLQVLEGPQGLYAATCSAPPPMRLGGEWKLHEVSFKPFAACRHAHPAIDAALELRKAGKLAAPFLVETYADALAFCDRPEPASELDAKFSLQHAVAVIADGRQAEPQDFTPAAIADLAALRAQVTVCEDPAITARYPAHFGARVNGLELVDTLGDPERPVSESDIVAKLRTLVAWGGLPAGEAERAIAVVLHGNSIEELETLFEDWLT